MTPQSLLKVLKATAEQKGNFLHADEEHCLATAEGLLENKERYGYLCCPCRLATSRDKDRDIICPCAYRDEDIREYGACFCSLFVDERHRGDPEFFPDVDERRPPENMD